MVFDFYQTKTYKELAEQSEVNKEYTYAELWDKFITNSEYCANDVVGVIDLDVMLFRVASACQSTYIDVSRGNKTKRYGTRTEFKAYCKDKDLDYDTFTIIDGVEAEPVSYCIATLKRSIKNVKERLGITKFIFTIGGSGNFRLDLPLPKKYKSNRDNMQKPVHLQAVRGYAVKHLGAYVIKGCENDDFVQGVSEWINNNTNAKAYLYTNDKDATQSLSKNFIYNPMTDGVADIKGGLGSLYEYKDSVKGTSLHWLLFQVFLGDPVDCYTSKPFFNKRYADKSYYKDFKDCSSEHELLSKWLDKWCELLPERVTYTDWQGNEQNLSRLELAEMMFKCAYMRTSPNDNTTFKSLLDKYKVTVND